MFTPMNKGAQRRILNLAIVVSLAVIGFVIYWNALSGPFIFDDGHSIVENPSIKKLSNFYAVPSLRYLTDLTFALNFAAGGFTPFDFHLVNVIMHITNAFLVFILASLIFKSPALSGAGGERHRQFISISAAVIFLVHPVQTGAVSYITQRYAVLAALFYLLTVIMYVKSRLSQDGGGRSGRIYYGAAIIIMYLAQLTKENCLTIPLMLVLAEAALFEGSAKNRALKLLPFFSLYIIAPAAFLIATLKSGKNLLTAFTDNQAFQQLTYIDPYTYVLTQLRVAITYLRLLFYPSGLRILYDYPVYESFAAPQVFLSFIFLASIFAGAIFLLVRSKKGRNGLLALFSFGIIWFFVANIVESLTPLRDVIFEHRVYLPGIGIVISFLSLIAYAATRFTGADAREKRGAAALWLITAAIAVIFSYSTHKRNDIWTDKMKFWQEAASKAPNSFAAISNLGSEYLARGKADTAIALYRRGLAIAKPYDMPLAYSKLASALILTRKYDEAIELSYTALKRTDDPIMALLTLGFAYDAKQEHKKAETAFNDALKLNPIPEKAAEIYYSLGNLYRETKRLDNAIIAFGFAAELQPEISRYHYNLAGAHMLNGDKVTALRHFRDALKLDPKDAETRNAVDVLSAEVGK